MTMGFMETADHIGEIMKTREDMFICASNVCFCSPPKADELPAF